jgi:hypothetical protein
MLARTLCRALKMRAAQDFKPTARPLQANVLTTVFDRAIHD